MQVHFVAVEVGVVGCRAAEESEHFKNLQRPIHRVCWQLSYSGSSVKPCYLPEIETECGPRQDLDFVAHHTHFVECWLSVENDVVVVLHVPLHLSK